MNKPAARDSYRDFAKRAAANGYAQVWCDKCDQPATFTTLLTNGSTAFRCSTHAWALVAPKGR